MPNDSQRSARPTILDVARHAGVSKSLVSLVIHNRPHVSAERRNAVLQAMKELGYRPNRNARNLVQTRTQTVAVVISDMANLWCVDFMDGFDTEFRSRGFNVLLGDGRRDGEIQRSLVETFFEYGVDGVCLGGTMRRPEAIQPLLGLVPVVVVHNLELTGPRVDIVVNDYHAGAYHAVEHLIELGHHRIGHLGGVGGVSRERREGYLAAMRAHGLAAQAIVEQSDFSRAQNASAAHRLLSAVPRPTAVFAVNDLAALALLDAAMALGLRVPEDLSIVGWDNTTYAAMGQVSLSSIDNDNRALGTRAARLLAARIEAPDRPAEIVRSETSLIVRSTSGFGPARN